MKAITERQKEILVFMREFKICNDFQCTIQEIANHFGFKSNNSVECHLNYLEKKGFIHRQKDRIRARSITITVEGWKV